MFNRYWRSYPWYIQFIQFLALLLVLVSFFILGLTPVILKIFQVPVEALRDLQESSPRNVINAAMLMQLFSSVGIFLAPALLFAYFTHPRPVAYLGLYKPKKKIHWVLPVIIIVSATPLLLAVASWLSGFDLSSDMQQTQDAYDNMLKAFLRMDSPVQLLFSIFIMAIVPGFSEELFFRGLIMRFAAKRSLHRYLPVVLSALVFATMHGNIYGMFPIFIAGILLGLFYLLTGSLWCSILAHICYNGLQVLLVYYSGRQGAGDPTESQVPAWSIIAGLLIFIPSLYALWRTREMLPPRWAADYAPGEMEASQS